MDSRTDAELVVDYAATNGDPSFSELVSRHGSMVHGV